MCSWRAVPALRQVDAPFTGDAGREYERGGIEADLTVTRLDENEFMVVTGAGPQIRENAGAAAGKVAVAAGTTIERRLTVPADRLAPAADGGAGMATDQVFPSVTLSPRLPLAKIALPLLQV